MNVFKVVLVSLLGVYSSGFTQVFEFYSAPDRVHRILKTEGYLVETIYETKPAKFILTRGGFLEESEGRMKVKLEFNSNYEADNKEELLLSKGQKWKVLSEAADQELEGNWLFASRLRNGQFSSRRGEDNSRKTLKILLDGHFQWIAYDTNGMKFYGSGGGIYTAQDRTYTETIQYFSKDNNRVGAILPFEYQLQSRDWHHKGLSSKGDPIHEVWSLRN